jgi:pimeloyl-ACP methyl ester carboxylesterase
MPLLILVFLLVDLLSLAFIFIDYKLWHQWYEYRNTAADDYAQRCLYGAIALLAYIGFGKQIIVLLLSKKRNGEDEPQMISPQKFFTVKRPDGTELFVEESGNPQGQPIVFVHGWNTTRQEWYYQRKHFEKDFRLIFFDLPGLGKSTRPGNKDFSLSKMAKDLNAVIEQTGAKNPVLWGHSIGGMTILTLVAKHKEIIQGTINGLILEHTTYTNPVKTIIFDKVMTAIQKPVLQPICYLMIGLSPVFWLMRWMSFINGNSQIMTRFLTFTGTQTPRQLNFITLLSTLAPPAVTARGVLGMFKYDVTRQLETIDIPVLIIAANKDRLTKPVASAYMQSRLPKSSLVRLQPAGHQGLVERHEEANAAADQFIEKVSGKSKLEKA